MSGVQPGDLPEHWCSQCYNMIGINCGCGLPVPMRQWRQAQPPRRRSVIGTTLLVLVTLFIIVPVLLMGGCAVLAGLGAAVGG